MMFPERIKYLRQTQGLNQVQLADKLGTTKQSISNWENDNIVPSVDMLEKIADFFNVDIDYLLGRTDKTTVLPETVGHYYINDETREIAQEVFENPELRTLFHVARDIPPERLKAHIEFMKSLKAQEKGDPDEPC